MWRPGNDLMHMNSKANKVGSTTMTGRTPSVFYWNLALLVSVITALAGAGCRSPHSSSMDDWFDSAALPAMSGTMNYSTNALHEGDVVGITFQYSTNFNTVQKIALDGTLNLDMVGPVKASGKTLMELQENLTRIYKPQVKDDVLTVKLITSGASIYVSGAVLRPGTVEMNRPLTVIEAVMGAGGFDNSRAKLSGVSVLRIENGQQKTYHVNLKRLLDGKDESPFYLKPFDIVYVPAKTFNY